MNTRLKVLFALAASLLTYAFRSEAFFNVLMLKKNAFVCDTANSGYRQGNSKFISTGFPMTIRANFPGAQTAGNLNVVSVGWYSDNGTLLNSISDTAGNSYSLALGPIKDGLGTLYIYYAKNIAASAAGNAVTVTMTSGESNAWLDIAEYSGLQTTTPLDGAGVSSGGSGTAISTGSLTTTNACDVLYSAMYAQGTSQAADTNFTVRGNAWSRIAQDRVVSSTGSYSASATQTSAYWTAGLVAFKKASGTQALDTIRNVQWNTAATNPATTASSRTVPFLKPQTLGNLNVVVVSWKGATGTSISAVADTAGNTYTQIGTLIQSTTLSQAVYYAKNIKTWSAGNTVTATFSGNINATVQILEYKGLSTTSPLDQANSATGTGTTASSPAVTTTSANELVLAIHKATNSASLEGTVSTGFRAIAMDPTYTSTFVQEKVVSSTGSYSASANYSASTEWITHIVTFH